MANPNEHQAFFSKSAKSSRGSYSFYKKQVQSTFRSLPNLLSKAKQSLKPAQLQHSKLNLTKSHWEDLVGTSLALTTRPEIIQERTLEVRARSAVAKSALSSAKNLIIKRKVSLGLDFGWDQITVRLGRF